MNQVAGLIEEMFNGKGAGIDQAKQAEVIRIMYQRKTAIPIYKGGFNLSNSQM